MFFEDHASLLGAFARVSQTVGARADYVQGGGGNTSVKLPGGLMAIKASGFCLKDITERNAYAVLDCDALRGFYRSHSPADFADVEKAGSDQAKAAVQTIEGLAPLRPSVEAGFHSLFRTFVVHTHSVYANLAACSTVCRDVAETAFSGADYTWGWVPYTDPGANLTFAIRDELARVASVRGKEPSVILMQNHGIIVHDDDPDRCMAIHTDANRRLALAFGVTGNSFPEIRVRPLAGGVCAAESPWLQRQLHNCCYSEKMFLEQPLYPDQLVFLTGVFHMDAENIEPGEAVASTRTGALLLRMDAKKAQTVAETIAAVLFVMAHIETAGYHVSTMGEAAKKFIANWESEKYRKSLAGKH